MGLNNKKLFFIFLLCFSFTLTAQALDCSLVEKFSDPKFANNARFWDDLGKINNQSDEAVAALIKKYDAQFSYSPNSAQLVNTSKSFTIPSSFSVSKKSEKAIKLLTSNQKKNFEDFVNILNEKGVKELYNNPGKWHYEKLKQYGGASSVRLDQGMRVLFKADNDAIEILDVGKHIGH